MTDIVWGDDGTYVNEDGTCLSFRWTGDVLDDGTRFHFGNYDSSPGPTLDRDQARQLRDWLTRRLGIVEFTTSGTWTKPAGACETEAVTIRGGGGGGAWVPASFGAGHGSDSDVSERVDEILGEGFGCSTPEAPPAFDE